MVQILLSQRRAKSPIFSLPSKRLPPADIGSAVPIRDSSVFALPLALGGAVLPAATALRGFVCPVLHSLVAIWRLI